MYKTCDPHNGVVAYENASCGFVCHVCFFPAVQTTKGADSSVNDCIMPWIFLSL